MTIATLSSASAVPQAGAALRRVLAAWTRDGARKWPFPPSESAQGRGRAGQGGSAGAAPAAGGSSAIAMPLPGTGVPGAGRAGAAAAPAGLGDVRQLSTVQALGVRRMVIDVLLVAMWGAMIPALMWLGAAAGF